MVLKNLLFFSTLTKYSCARKGLSVTSGVQFGALPLVKKFARAQSPTDVPVLLVNQPNVFAARLSIF